MKKIIITLILFLVLLEFTSAALINITKTDFTNEPKQAYRLYNGDGISFIDKGKEYVVSIGDIGKTSVKLRSYVYKDDQKEGIELLLDQRFSNKIDFDRDDYYDLKVSLGRLENNSAIIIFEKINESKAVKDNNISNGNLNNKGTSNFDVKMGILVTAIIIVIGLIIYFLVKKRATS